jgi:hypothetical protein
MASLRTSGPGGCWALTELSSRITCPTTEVVGISLLRLLLGPGRTVYGSSGVAVAGGRFQNIEIGVKCVVVRLFDYKAEEAAWLTARRNWMLGSFSG